MMMLLERIRDNGILNYSLGQFVRTSVELPFHFVAVEPTDLFNQPFVSCIPAGVYEVFPHVSPTFGDCFLVKDVKDRQHILIHPLNKFKQTEGCIGVGSRFSHLDEDGVLDIIDSKNTLQKLLKLADGKPFQLHIFDSEKKQVFYHVAANRKAFY